MILLTRFFLLSILISLLGCSGGGSDAPAGDDPTDDVQSYTIVGSVTGLTGTVILQNIGGETRTVTDNGSLTIVTAIADGTAYSVTVNSQPVGQICTVTGGSGTVAGADIINIDVSCINLASYSVGGTITGLAGTAILQNNAGDDLSVATDGTFTFVTSVFDMTPYNVTVSSHPSGQECTVSNGSSNMAGADIANVSVVCVIDNTPPGMPVLTNGPDGYQINYQPTWEWTSGGGGNGTYRYDAYIYVGQGICHPAFLDLDITGTEIQATELVLDPPLPEGSQIMCIQERDNAGNWSEIASLGFSVDTIAPTVVANYPADNAAGAEAAPAISVEFSEYVPWDIDERLNLITVYDSSGTRITGDTVPGSDSSVNRYFFESNVRLVENETYTVTATSLFIDNNGNTLEPHVWEFTVRPTLGFYPNAPDWNDYVKNDGPTIFEATGTPCDGTETGGYQSCIHGGEMRAFEVPGRTSCSGLSASDQLVAFEWTCLDNGGSGPVKFVSVGLQEDASLNGLVKTFYPRKSDFTPNSITVLDGNTEIFSTAPDSWWSNRIYYLTSTAATLYLDLPGVVYVPWSSNGSNIRITADKVSIASHFPISSRGNNGPAPFAATDRKFLWIEGDYRPEGDLEGWVLTNVQHSVLRKLKVTGAELGSLTLGKGGIYLNGSNNNRIEDVSVAFNGIGLNLLGSSNNTISGIQAVSNAREGITLASSSGNILMDISANNNFTGIELAGGAVNNLVGGITASHNVKDGLLVAGTSNRIGLVTAMRNGRDGVRVENGDYSIFSNITASGNLQNGFSLTGANGITIENLVATTNGPPEQLVLQSSGVYMEDSDVRFTGQLKVGSNGDVANDCILAGTTTGLADDCTATDNSDHSLTSSVNASGSIIGIIGVDDTVNTSDQGALNTLYPSSVDLFTFDWLEFETPLRNWGASGYANTNFDNFLLNNRSRFGCVSHILSVSEAGCDYWGDPWHPQGHIWDFSMPVADTVLRAAAPIHMSGDAADTISHPMAGGSEVYLRNAVEMIETNPFAEQAGDGDGLCESGERCLYTPNIGSYMGGGDPVSAGTFTDGDTLNSILLMEFPNNGE